MRTYYRTTSGADAGIQGVVHLLVWITAPVWVPALLVLGLIGWANQPSESDWIKLRAKWAAEGTAGYVHCSIERDVYHAKHELMAALGSGPRCGFWSDYHRDQGEGYGERTTADRAIQAEVERRIVGR